MANQRRRLLTDRPVQVQLVLRVLLHWLAFFVAVAVGLPLFRAIVLGEFTKPLSELATTGLVDSAILFVLFLALLPYFVYDTFKITNRFAGPMYRLRQAFQSLARGETFRPIKFREGDFWQDAAQEFNDMVRQLQSSPEGGREDGEPPQEELAVLSAD